MKIIRKSHSVEQIKFCCKCTQLKNKLVNINSWQIRNTQIVVVYKMYRSYKTRALL